MRVGERGPSQPRTDAGEGGFADALRRAADRAEGRGSRAARLEPRRPARTGSAAPEAAGAGRFAPAIDAEPLRASAAPVPADHPETPALAALARTLPVALAATCARQGAPLALSFGAALDVELRVGTTGVELVLRPEPRLARIVEAELPGLLAAMRARGVDVARAEVRPRAGPARRAR
jgi:hypothetical protein